MNRSIHAACHGDFEAVRRFVEVEGVDVNLRTDRGGFTPLHIAVDCASHTTMRYLISNNAGLEVTDFRGKTVLMLASKRGRLEAVRILLEAGANVNAINIDGGTALTEALDSKEGHRVIPTLLRHGADVNPEIKCGRSPIVSACCSSGAVEVVKQLLEHGARTWEMEDKHGITALHRAVELSDEATVRLLISYGAKVNGLTKVGPNMSPLWRAARKGKFAIVRALCEHDAKVDAIDEDGRNALHIVKDCAETTGILLEHCRGTMTESGYCNFLLKRDNGGNNVSSQGCPSRTQSSLRLPVPPKAESR